jgi:hypothetical protein
MRETLVRRTRREKSLKTMTFEPRLRNFSASLFFLALAAGLSNGCSSSDGDEGSGSSTGGSSSTGASSNAGGSSAGGSSSGGSQASGGGGNPDVLVGKFTLEIVATSATEGTTGIIGKVYDGPTPSNLKWTVVTESGDCLLETPDVPFCDPACGTEVCVDDNVCQANPTVKKVGDVNVTGLKAADGTSPTFKLTEINGNYMKPPAVELSFPPFEEGDTVRFEAAGGEVGAFALEATGIAPLVVTSENLALDPASPFVLEWEPAGNPEGSTVYVKLDISHHGGTKGQVRCEVADNGSVSIDASLIEQLIDLGVAGFPTVRLKRSTGGSATVPAGRVELAIDANAELGVDVPGVVSCNEDSDCETGTCQADRTCQ